MHTRKTALDSQGQHYWNDKAGAPSYTPPPGGQQPGLGDFYSITVRQGTSNPPQAGYVGYAYQAYSTGVKDCTVNAPGQLAQMANLNTDAGNGGHNAQLGYTTSSCGLKSNVRLTYSLLHNGLNVYLDTNGDRLLLRPISLDPPSFSDIMSNQAFGMLNLESTRCLLHPTGHLISINEANHKIETLKLPAEPQADAYVAQYYLARTCAGQGSRPGLITSPVASAISADGAILVLESGNNRIQAFDVNGNPLRYFSQQQKPYFLRLDATDGNIYLDLAVEFSGYLYVLSKDANNNHRLDIYHPGQTGAQPISTTHNLNAAKLTVDYWRSVYTLNYEVLQLPGGGIPPFTEPSVSLWVPSTT